MEEIKHYPESTCLLLSKQANEFTWLKKSFGLPGIPMPRKNFAKPSILSPGSCKLKSKASGDIQTEFRTIKPAK